LHHFSPARLLAAWEEKGVLGGRARIAAAWAALRGGREALLREFAGAGGVGGSGQEEQTPRGPTLTLAGGAAAGVAAAELLLSAGTLVEGIREAHFTDGVKPYAALPTASFSAHFPPTLGSTRWGKHIEKERVSVRLRDFWEKLESGEFERGGEEGGQTLSLDPFMGGGLSQQQQRRGGGGGGGGGEKQYKRQYHENKYDRFFEGEGGREMGVSLGILKEGVGGGTSAAAAAASANRLSRPGIGIA